MTAVFIGRYSRSETVSKHGPQTVLTCLTVGRSIEVPYFAPSMYWPWAMGDYYAGQCGGSAFRPPTVRPEEGASYLTPCAFMADPKYWAGETRTLPPQQLRAVRAAEVLFPTD